MVNFEKMDDKDFVFVNKPVDPKEEKAFSDFLKLRGSLKPRAPKRRKVIIKAKTV